MLSSAASCPLIKALLRCGTLFHRVMAGSAALHHSLTTAHPGKLHSFVTDVGDIKTEVIAITTQARSPTKLMVIPGNPGIVHFYKEFVHHLFEKTGGLYDVIALGHAGHTIADVGNGKRIFSLQDQINHKLEFLKQFPKGTRFVLLGHSVGAFINVQIAARSSEENLEIAHLYHLFPTLHHLYKGLDTPVKVFMQPILRPLIGYLFHYCPLFVKRWFIHLGRRRSSSASAFSDEARLTLEQMVTGDNAYYLSQNALYMAYREAHEIVERDDELLEQLINRMTFLYGRNDRYTPIHFVESIRMRWPEAALHLAEEGVEHAFVIAHARPVAEWVARKCEEMKH